ncbi:uncharacterized protein N7446_009491 [Penicillium canescens]|nr:uncharacterized protein N7446_009491 [Penicillium canescens]KAJ6046399.1 hypothetical protein N7444_007653 [Penicillium canescens]KAJ6053479.1 hypothetical protein N7446_009491 [Penicillium canescens]
MLTAQAIAFAELSKPARAEVISASVADAYTLHAKYSSITVEELAVEIATNPYYSYSLEKTVINALRRLKLKLTQGPVKQKINDAVMEMFDQLVTADIPSMEPSSQVKTPLLHHQKQVFWFMTQKEKPRAFGPKEEDNNSLWRIEIQSNGSKRYKDIISGVVVDQEPPQILGGLLADMMGLGKTLSLALSSLKESREWTRQMPNRHLVRQTPGIRNTKTTLLVMPLSAVNNWVA